MASKAVHDQAIKLVTSFMKDIEDAENLNELITGTTALHKYHRHRAGAVVAFNQDAVEIASDEIDEAFGWLDAIPIFQSTKLLKSLDQLIEARTIELDERFEEAHNQYKENQHPALDLEKRIKLVKIKQALIKGKNNLACETAKNTFGPSSPVLTAAQIITEERGTSPNIHSPDLGDMFALDQETGWRFTLSMYFASRADRVRADWIKKFLLSL
jgi:hypothetical protein